MGRVFGVLAGTPAAELLARDGLVMAAGIAVGALSFLPWLAVIAIVYLVGGTTTTFLPEHALSIFTISNALAALVAAGFQWRAS